MRGIKEENLQGLRKRIVTLFLQYIKTPQFNPAAARVLKVPQDLSIDKIDTFYCTTCQRYLPSHEFQVSASNTKMGKCRNCRILENVAIKRVDYTKFRYLYSSSSSSRRSIIIFLVNKSQLSNFPQDTC
jgi:hypothetical protein